MNDQTQNLRRERLHDISDTPVWSDGEFSRRKIRKLRYSIYGFAGMAIAFGAFGTFATIRPYLYLIGTAGMIFGILASEWRIRRLESLLLEERKDHDIGSAFPTQQTGAQQIDDGNAGKPSGDERTQ